MKDTAQRYEGEPFPPREVPTQSIPIKPQHTTSTSSSYASQFQQETRPRPSVDLSTTVSSPATSPSPRSSLSPGSASPSSYGSPRGRLWQRRKGISGTEESLRLPTPRTTAAENLKDALREEGYTLCKVIGRSANTGTMVIGAMATGRFQMVAVKCAMEHPDEGTLRGTLKNELKILRRLSHPSIVTAMRMIEAEIACCMVMEYVQGVELATILPDWGSGDVADAMVTRRLLFEEIVSTVLYLHTNSVAHRDLHTGNVLVKEIGEESDSSNTSGRSAPRVKIVDFGSAREIDGVDTLAEAGFQEDMNPFILPPESMILSADAFACDIFALGLLGAGLVSGRVTLSKHVWKKSELVFPRSPDEKYVLAPALASFLGALLSLAHPQAASAFAVHEALPPVHQWLSKVPQLVSL